MRNIQSILILLVLSAFITACEQKSNVARSGDFGIKAMPSKSIGASQIGEYQKVAEKISAALNLVEVEFYELPGLDGVRLSSVEIDSFDFNESNLHDLVLTNCNLKEKTSVGPTTTIRTWVENKVDPEGTEVPCPVEFTMVRTESKDRIKGMGADLGTVGRHNQTIKFNILNPHDKLEINNIQSVQITITQEQYKSPSAGHNSNSVQVIKYNEQLNGHYTTFNDDRKYNFNSQRRSHRTKKYTDDTDVDEVSSDFKQTVFQMPWGPVVFRSSDENNKYGIEVKSYTVNGRPLKEIDDEYNKELEENKPEQEPSEDPAETPED